MRGRDGPQGPGAAPGSGAPPRSSNRPRTVSALGGDESTIKKRGVGARLHGDGQPYSDLVSDDQVVVRRAAHSIRFVHPPGYSYYAMLREKLHWSETPERLTPGDRP